MVIAVETVELLRNQIRRLERSRPLPASSVIRTGCEALDRLFPEGGVLRGSIVEWIQGGLGSGAATLALHYARQACGDGLSLVVVDRLRQLYPPALAGWGIELSQVILVHPRSIQEEQWVWDQALRCPAVAAVWGEMERLEGLAFRRLQLAVESSGGVGLLIRPPQARRDPSWADARLLVQPCFLPEGRQLQVRLLHCRGAGRRGVARLAFDEWSGQLMEAKKSHETHSGDLVARLARATVVGRPTGTYGTNRHPS
jgi:hypothetical protein